MNTYRVVYYVRKLGAIGQPEAKGYTVQADDVSGALDKAREAIYASGLEAVRPYSVHKE